MNYSQYFIRNFIKQKLKYSYKKGWSRVLKANSVGYNIMMHILDTKLFIELSTKRLIFSIDESWFNRSLKKEYSWLLRNKSGSSLNIDSFGRCSLILAIGSDGEWMVIIKTNTVKSDDYINFLTLFGYMLSMRG